MSPVADTAPARQAGFPRVSGDEPTAFVKLGYLSEFSPRERG